MPSALSLSSASSGNLISWETSGLIQREERGEGRNARSHIHRPARLAGSWGAIVNASLHAESSSFQ